MKNFLRSTSDDVEIDGAPTSPLRQGGEDRAANRIDGDLGTEPAQRGFDPHLTLALSAERIEPRSGSMAAATGEVTGNRFGTEGITDSDKYYWHRYTETYLRAFAALGEARRVVEFGVLHGASISWLAERFPEAEIVGADLLVRQPEWPFDTRISYRQVDQADRAAVRAMLASVLGDVDLIIDDGSHIPQHQASCLAEGLARLRPGGLYILEDICTSHPLQPAFAHYSLRDGRRLPNALNVLLAIQHLRDIAAPCDAATVASLAAPSFLTERDVSALFDTIAEIEIYKRTRLPLRCYACGTSDFDYVNWLCRCGAELYHPANSMTALVWKR
jgi:predicted O-methyltransferase YrrM